MSDLALLVKAVFNTADYLEEMSVDVSEAIKRRDKREPGRRRKEEKELELFKVMQRYFRQQKQRMREILEKDYPDRKALVPPQFSQAFDNREIEAQLRALLYQAALDGTLLFMENNTIGFDQTLVNPYVIEWARKYAGEFITKIDQTTMESVQRAVAMFAETPGMTVGDVIDMLPFTDQRSELIATTEITRAYAEGNMEAGKELVRQFPGVRVIKHWFTNEDDIVCLICGPVAGEEVGIEDAFSNGESSPPAHPGCRCWINTTTALAEL